jgi:GTP cyclohydrolase IA
MLRALQYPETPLAQTTKVTAPQDEMADEVDLEAIKGAVRTILKAVGEDPDRPGLQETPRRAAKMYAEMFAGLRTDPARHLHVTFPETYDVTVHGLWP